MKHMHRRQLSSRTSFTNQDCQSSSLKKFSRDLLNLKLQNNIEKQNRKRKKDRLQKVQLCIQKIKKMIELCQKDPVNSLSSMPHSIVSTPPIFYPNFMPPYGPSFKEYKNQERYCMAFNKQLPQIGSRASKKLRNSLVQTQNIDIANYKNNVHSSNYKLKIDKKQPNKKLIRKFRVVVIAVYFIIVFPAFSRKFSELRFQWYRQKIQDKQHLQKLHSQIQLKLTLIAQLMQCEANDVPIISMNTFVCKFLSLLSQKLTNKSTLKKINWLFAVGITNGHFVIEQEDLMYSRQQLPFLKLKKIFGQYMQLRINEHASVALLLIRIFVEIVIESYIELVKTTSNISEQIKQMIKKSLVFFHQICKEMYIKGLKNYQQFTDKQDLNSQYLDIQLLSSNNSIKSNKNRINTLQQSLSSRSQDSLLQYNQNAQQNSFQNLFPVIEQLQNYAQIQKQIQHNTALLDIRQEVTECMIRIALKIRQSIQKQKKQVYNIIWQRAVNQKHTLMKSISNKSSQLVNSGSAARKVKKHRRYQSQNNEQTLRYEPKQVICATRSSGLTSRTDLIKNKGSRSQKISNNLCSIKTLQSQYQMTDMSSNHRIRQKTSRA